MDLPPDKTLLLIDAASPRCFVGLWCNGQWLAHTSPSAPALEGIFAGVEGILAQAKITLEDVDGFIHLEGPGSILGIRLSAMAIRTWRALPQWKKAPVWALGSLHFSAAAYAIDQGATPVSVMSEFRNGRWNLLTPDTDQVVAVDSDYLANVAAPLIYVRQRKSWQSPPAHAIEWAPDWTRHAPTLRTPGLLRQVEQPDVFVTEEAVFQKWSADRHRA